MTTQAFRTTPVRRKILRYVPMILLAGIFVFPLVFMVISSFKPDSQIFADLRSIRAFLPVGEISLANYAGVFDRVPALRFLINSTVGIARIMPAAPLMDPTDRSNSPAIIRSATGMTTMPSCAETSK